MGQNKVLPFRVQPLWNTTAGWNADSVTVPVFGELVCEQTGGVPLYKIGDGINIYNDLSYLSVPESDYLGMAVTTTEPPGLTTDAYYFTVVTGNFVYLGGIVVPSTSLFAIISYSFSTTTWSYNIIISTSTFPAPTLQKVLNSGAIGSVSDGTASITLEDTVTVPSQPAVLSIDPSSITLLQGTQELVILNSGIDSYVGYPSLIFSDATTEYLRILLVNPSDVTFDEKFFFLPTWRSGELAMIGTGNAPSVTLSTGAGTGAILVFGTDSDDNSGVITLTTEGVPAATATIATITFVTPYTGKAVICLAPANAAAAALSGATQVWAICNEPATEFVITSGATGLTTSTIYKWNYVIVQ